MTRGTVKEINDILIYNYKVEIKPYVHDASCAVTLEAGVSGIDKSLIDSF